MPTKDNTVFQHMNHKPKKKYEAWPLVSIAIITYNQKDFLRECIESCLAQDYPNFEIVVADDGSSDGTQEMLLQYSYHYHGKFVLRLSDSNQGITANSNLAHFACSGKYIAWMGGDDLMLPGKLSRQVEFMENNSNCTICYHNLDVFDSDTGQTLSYFNDKKKQINGNVRECIKYGAFNGACSTMIKASNAPHNGFDGTLPVVSDWLYWVETLANGGTINYIDEVLGRYRRHTNNVSVDDYIETHESVGNITKYDLDGLNTCNIILARYPKYMPEAIYMYSRRILSLRFKLNYRMAMWTSFCLTRNIKVLLALMINIITLNKVKL